MAIRHLSRRSHTEIGLPPRSLRARLTNFALSDAPTPFPPSKTDQRLLGIDIWGGSGNWDIDTMLAYGPPKYEYAVIRSGQGAFSSYDDSRYIENVVKAEGNNFPWMQYHVEMPQQNGIDQVNHLVEIINRLGGVVPKVIWWDVELVNGQSKKRISDLTIELIERTREMFVNVLVGWYTGKWFVDAYMELQQWMSDPENIAWLASWLYPEQQKEHPGPPAIPLGMNLSQVMIHQTTSWGDGGTAGITHPRVALDRWGFPVEIFNEIFELGQQPPPNGDLEDRMLAVEQRSNSNESRIGDLEAWGSGLSFGSNG